MNILKYKRGVVGPLLLGIIPIVGIFVYMGSQADQIFYKNAAYQVKNLTDKAALAAANARNSGESELDAENIARKISKNNKIFNKDLSEDIVFSWGSSEVNATLPTYEFDTFWFRFMGLNSLDLNNIYSTAGITQTADLDDPIRYTSGAPKPFCMPQGIVDNDLAKVGDELTLNLDLEDCWSENTLNKLYGIDLDWQDENFAGADNLVDFRRVVAQAEDEYGENEKITSLPQEVGLVATNLANDPSGCSGSAADTNMNVYVENVIKGFNCYLGNEDQDTCVHEPGIYITDEMDIAICANNPDYNASDPTSAKIVITGIVRVKIDDFNFDRTGAKGDDYAEFVLTVLPGVKDKVKLDK